MPYPQTLYGAALSAALAVALGLTFGRCRRTPIVLAVAVALFLMPLAWNLILSDTGATGLFSPRSAVQGLPDRASPSLPDWRPPVESLRPPLGSAPSLVDT